MKGEKAAQLELLLHAHPEGMRKAEIARRIGVHRSTVSRYVDELKKYTDLSEENNLIKLAQKPDEEPLNLSVYEGLAFNLGAKMLAQNSDIQNPHLVTGLRKIAMSMETYAPSVSENIMKLAEEIDRKITTGQGVSGKYNAVMEALVDGWVSGKIVKVKYESDSGTEETEFAPYFIGFVETEDGRNPISVTGRLRHTTDIETLEIAKITSAEILNETYTIPDNLKAFKRKSEADDYESPDMVPLVLQLKEKSALNSFGTLFHSKPELEKKEDGTYICKMSIENSIELSLRIIQCGTSAKIIGPESYKKRFLGYIASITQMYDAK
ncbi:MAG: WYL domain-containing protein [Sphaerochaetaceae bacterium]|nr:WYL domain-containing protein [Sphaerochaetaceae bacterium]MDD3163322.1 WYL domain-containing protein [Sphaerochaetaceae bacterium]MDD4007428.1 WYL domain-containing protein [Sphaerochaetaceae bacterium]MDD4396595.1 WYL domain-containing protein [Sphaerochaetaceae bacterium]